MRGAIVGLGNVAIHGHLPGWRGRGDVEIVAATDVQASRRAELAGHLPGARWYDSVSEMLAGEDLHFVDVCTPPTTHAGLIEAATGRGLHVLCEKPLVCSLDELAAAVASASARGRVLYTVHNWHHAPIVRRTLELVRGGAVGRIRHVAWHTLRTRPAASRDDGQGNWRVDPAVAGGGVLTDHGWHVFYVLARWMGHRPLAVDATLERRRHTQWPVEDTATVRLAFPAGATAEVFLTWAADERRNWVEVRGADGTLRLEDDTLVLTRGGDHRPATRWPCPPALSNGSHHPDWFAPVAAGFLDAVGGGAAGADNLAEASLCATLDALARESSRRRAEIPLVPAPLELPA